MYNTRKTFSIVAVLTTIAIVIFWIAIIIGLVILIKLGITAIAHPELIGQFFGKIVNAFNEAK